MYRLQILKTLAALAAAGFNPRAFIVSLDTSRSTPARSEDKPKRDGPEKR